MALSKTQQPDQALAQNPLLKSASVKQLRTSSYTIYVDLDDVNNVLLVHGYSGAYDRVSRTVADYLKSQENTDISKPLYGEWSDEPKSKMSFPTPPSSIIEVLKNRGYLTMMTVEEEENYFSGTAAKLHHIASRLMPGYIFMPTYNCNLRCPYCFQDHMRKDPSYNHLLRTISPEMVDRIFSAMPAIETRHGVPEEVEIPRRITFFGGEPLLAASYPIIKYIMEKAWSMGKAKFSAITNGTELHHYQDLLGPEKIAFLQITMDGPPAEHDKRRIYPDGSGSFEVIARNITMALDLGTRISLRMNIDYNNIHQLPELADSIIDLGWDKYPNFAAYTAPIHATNEQTDRKTTMNSLKLNQLLTKMRLEHQNMKVIGRPDDGLIDRARQIFEHQQDPLPNFKASFCGAHNKMYVFDAFGDIYACWERTGDKKLRIGYINEHSQVTLNDELNNQWRSRTVVTNPVCRKCRYALYCGGGCAIMAEQQNKQFYSNYCDGFGKRFRASVAEAYLDHVAGVNVQEMQEQVCDM